MSPTAGGTVPTLADEPLRFGTSTNLIIVGLHQRLLLFLLLTRLVTGDIAANGLLAHFTLCDLLQHILVHELSLDEIKRRRDEVTCLLNVRIMLC